MIVWSLVAFLWKCQCIIRTPEQHSEGYCKVKVYYQLVRQKNLGVDSNPLPRARVASPACWRTSAYSWGRIVVHTDLVVALKRGVVHFIGAVTRISLKVIFIVIRTFGMFRDGVARRLRSHGPALEEGVPVESTQGLVTAGLGPGISAHLECMSFTTDATGSKTSVFEWCDQ